MKRISIIGFLSFLIILMNCAQDTNMKSLRVNAFNIGGVAIAIPPPNNEMVEVGKDNREIMKIYLPNSNRLIAGFASKSDSLKLTKLSEDTRISKYAMVQVMRQTENMNITANDFIELINNVKENLGDMNSSIEKAEDEFNNRMKSLDLEEVTLDIGTPHHLGCIFSKEDAYGFAMIMPFSMGGESITMVAGAVFMRVKDRLLYVYLYDEFQDVESVNRIRTETETWADSIIEANK